MASTSTSLSLSLPILISTFNPNPNHFLNIQFSSSISPSFPRIILSPSQNPLHSNYRKRISFSNLHASTSEEILTTEATNLVEKSQEIASTGDDGVSTAVTVLLSIAFIGLSVLTIGVIYIAVTDFLQKREKEKFEKEEAEEKKKGKKKKKLRAKTGPRGFGQKIEEENDDDFS